MFDNFPRNKYKPHSKSFDLSAEIILARCFGTLRLANKGQVMLSSFFVPFVFGTDAKLFVIVCN